MLKLSSLVQNIELQDENIKGFLEKKTGRVIFMNTELENYLSLKDLSLLSNSQQEIIEELREAHYSINWIALPPDFLVDELDLMYQFVKEKVSLENRTTLLSAIEGRGGARRFKNEIFYLELEKTWFLFKKRSLEKTIQEWLEKHGIEYY